jgi:hypothetical protein
MGREKFYFFNEYKISTLLKPGFKTKQHEFLSGKENIS